MAITRYFHLDDLVKLKYGYGIIIHVTASIMRNFLIIFLKC